MCHNLNELNSGVLFVRVFCVSQTFGGKISRCMEEMIMCHNHDKKFRWYMIFDS